MSDISAQAEAQNEESGEIELLPQSDLMKQKHEQATESDTTQVA
jgi:hypothetical protein